ncbi:MAG: TRAP transporter substrate-binding protein DctP, partial [Cellvibrionaceae bacterium]|nr:TRAP transporter substrate-binding protein DctP [Cellvibrionaceae bacterium]
MSPRNLLILLCLLPNIALAQHQWRLGLITPPPHRWTQTAQDFATALKHNSENQMQLSVFPSGQLGNEAQMLQLLQTGAIDFAFFTTSELANRLPEFAAFYRPHLAEDANHAAAILRSDSAREILSKAESLGLIGLGFGMAGMRQILL